jgi:hypothetical protein
LRLRLRLVLPLGVVALSFVVLFGEVVVGVVGSAGVPAVGEFALVSPAFGGVVGLAGLALSTGGGVVVWLPAELPRADVSGVVDVPGDV